jgi:5-methylcytosine-specific restriction enzyme A
MSIGDGLSRVLDSYVAARSEQFTGHPLGELVRKSLPEYIRWLRPDDDLLIAKGSVGQGNWARGPWIAVFDRLVTDSAQRGFYPVYLFAEDMGSVYLSLNQGMTEIRERYRSDARTNLLARAANFRAMLGPLALPFTSDPIDLTPASTGNDTTFYEAGNICSIKYSKNNLPSEQTLIDHLNITMDMYRLLIDLGAADEDIKHDELEIFTEGGSPARAHLRIERNRRLAAKVKKLKGSSCEVCFMNFSDLYGDIGLGYIEAHHLIPFANLKSTRVPLDPCRDFAVLCSNCHRMAHRMPNPADIAALRAIVMRHAV